MRTVSPADVVKPASSYVQGVVHKSTAERLVISGQVGAAPDGRIEKGTRAQMERAWTNLLGVLKAAGMERRNLVKITVFMTEPGQVGLYREMRDKHLAGHLCAATYLQVAGLATPDYLVEIEAEAVKE